ncbi:hypothetical protein cyc_05923 [Cyclospora cayetanensis]|uniref:Transmembrane protein n=1 Tax=Cyclospora cayetanensis TaxID=88456 RepID=A0A1D3CWL8_9EIME|nr:hypothetical protein cyc_05923 [Cyclospora cayetanensis]
MFGTIRWLEGRSGFAWVVSLFFAQLSVDAAAVGSYWDTPGVTVWGSSGLQQQAYDTWPLVYEAPLKTTFEPMGAHRTPASSMPSSMPHQVHSQVPAGLPAHQLSLSDLPVDAEGTSAEEQRGFHLGKYQFNQNKGSMQQVFLDFFRKPRLSKVLLVAAVLLVSFFLFGVVAKISQVLIAIWLATKALQLAEQAMDQPMD